MRDVKYGLGGVPFPPFELNERAVTGYEAAGLDLPPTGTTPA